MSEQGADVEPHPTRLVSEDLPPAGGSIGPEPEDFVVDELPLFAPSGSGEQLWVRVRKRLWTTPDMVRAVAGAAGVRERDVGYAGMKDKHALTTQWLSLPVQALEVEAWQLPPGLELIEASRAARKLRTGQLKGNLFRIRLTGVPTGGAERARAICGRVEERGLLNYFGAQRFGDRGENLSRALRWLEAGAPARGGRARFYRKFHPSVIQSEVFNRYVSLRLDAGLDRLLDGEVVRLDGTNSLFVVDEPERELDRLRTRDIHQTGPIHGSRMKEGERLARELEQAARATLPLSAEAWQRLETLAHGTRRDVRVRPGGLSLQAPDETSLVLEFALGPGSYATELVRELTRDAGLARRRADILPGP
jgi:tRNA pseudouridine13 synthase